MTPTEYSTRPQVAPAHGTLAAPTEKHRGDNILYVLALGAAASILFSIAVSQILLGLGLLGLLLLRKPWRMPPIVLPLLLFFAATIVAVLLSGDPWRGSVQIRKFFVFGIIPLMFSTFRTVRQIRHLILVWAGFATLSGLVALWQAFERWKEAVSLQAPRYDYVLDGRITGLQSHWMTFGGAQMVVLLMLLALLLFTQPAKWKSFGWVCLAVIWTALVLGLTRAIFMVGVPAGVAVIAWNYKRWLLLVLPVALALLPIAPVAVRERVISVLRPHGEVDSNSRRSIMRQTGWRMIQAHPWFGVGPEQVELQFSRFLPEDVPKPLPKGWYGHLHNIYLQYAAERGVPALLCVLWMIAKMILDFRAAIKRWPGHDARFVWFGALAVISAVLAEGLFEHNLGDSEVLTLFLAATTCGYVAIDSVANTVQASAGQEL